MANNSPTIVAASLSDDQLKKSIDSLVTHVGEAMKKMVQSTNNAVGEMEAKLKSLGGLKIDSGGTNDGGTGRRTQQHEKLTKAVNDASEAVSKETQKLQDLQQSLSGASDREQNFISQKERAANTIAQENELLSKQQSELAALKTQQQSLADAHQKDMQSRQQLQSQYDSTFQKLKTLSDGLRQARERYKEFSEAQTRLSTDANALRIVQGKNFTELGERRLFEALNQYYREVGWGRKQLDADLKDGMQTFSDPRLIEILAQKIKGTEEDARKLVLTLQENTDKLKLFKQIWGEFQGGLSNIVINPNQQGISVFKNNAEALKSSQKADTEWQERLNQTVAEYRANETNLASAKKELNTLEKQEAETKRELVSIEQQQAQATQQSNAIRQESLNLDAKVQEKEKEISETRGRIATATREQSEAEKNASQAAKEKANIQSQVANQEKQVAEAKKQLATATQQQTEVEKQSVQNIAQQTAARDKQIKKNQEVKMSYDQMQTALEKATRLPSEMRMPDMAKSARESFQAFYKGINEQARNLESLIKAEDNRLASIGLGRFSTETRSQLAQVDASIDQTRWKMNFLYQEEKRLNQEALRQKVGSVGFEQAWLKKDETKSARVREGERLIELEKERQRIIASDPTVQQLDRNIEQTRAKIQQLLADEKRLQSESLKQTVGSSEFEKLWNQKYQARDQRIAAQEKLIQLEKERQNLVAVDPIRTQLANVDELRAKHEKVLGVMRDETTTNNKVAESQQQVTSSTQQSTQAAQRYTEEIRNQAAAIRATKEWQEKGHVVVGDVNYYDKERVNVSKRDKQLLLSLEEQIVQAQQKEAQEALAAAEAKRQQAQAAKEAANAIKSVSYKTDLQMSLSGFGVTHTQDVTNEQVKQYQTLEEQLQKLKTSYASMNEEAKKSEQGLGISKSIFELQRQRTELLQSIAQQMSKKQTSAATDQFSSLRQSISSVLGVQSENVRLFDAEKASSEQLSKELKMLQSAYSKLSASRIAKGDGTAIADEIQRVQRALQKLQATQTRPTSLKSVMGLDEKTLDDISYKMRQLSAYRSGLDVSKQSKEITQVNDEYNRLKKRMDEVMQKNQQMIASNTALGRSWNYMKNRLAFYFTIGASTSFIKNLIEVRSQYEMNERALGILIDSAERGTRIFNELSQMALVSPYTLIELSTAAKQLTAYDIAAKDVVDTTRRLADMAAAVGIPIERLTYALGQIKAYGYLNARDARMFSNAGIPLVKQLAEHYTELEGRMVSVADVYDRIKKKAIDMTDVMQVINKMTDEGGKFFDFQAKMAGTLKVQLANLTLAWNNMLNDIGASEQGTISTGIGLLKELFLEWKNISKMVTNLAIGFGVVKAAQLAYYGVVMGTNKAIALETVLGNRLSNNLRSLTSSMNAARMSSTALWVGIATFAAAAVVDILRGNEAMKEFNKTLRENSKNTYEDLDKFLKQYSELKDSLYKEGTRTVSRRVVTNDPAGGKLERIENREETIKINVDINEKEAVKAWEVIRERIELSTHASDEYITRLMAIENISERLRQGFSLLESMQAVSAALKNLGDDGIKLKKDWSEWWNLGLLPDGTIENLKDTYSWLGKINEEFGSLENARKILTTDITDEGLPNAFKDEAQDFIDEYEKNLAQFREDLKLTTDSVMEFIKSMGWSKDADKINEVFKQVTNNLISQNMLDPQQAYTLQVEIEKARSRAAKEALRSRLNDLAAASHEEQNRETKTAIVEEWKKQKQIYDAWDTYNGRTKVEWERFTKWLKEQHISETTAMFRNMEAKDIASLNFMEGKHADWVKKMVTQYAKEHKMSYDEAFDYLKSWVQSANTWSVTIPVMLNVQEQSDFQKEFSKRVREKYGETALERFAKVSPNQNEDLATYTDNAWKNLKKLREDEKKYNRDNTEWGKKKKQETADEIKLQEQALKLFNQRLEKETKGNKKDKVLEALKMEIDLVKKLQSDYDKLTKSGANSAEALMVVRNAYGKTINLINAKMGAIGLPKLDMSIITGKDPNKVLAFFDKVKDALSMKGLSNVERMKAVEGVIQEFTVSAKTYNLDKITKGLNNELGKLKEEYELAVELDADPEMGNLFADMMGLDMDSLPRTVEEYADRYSKILNKFLKDKGSNLQFTGDELYGLTRDDMAEFQRMFEAGTLNEEWFNAIKKAYEDISGKRKKEIEDSVKGWQSLIQKYAEYEHKISEVAKKANQERLSLVKQFGSKDEKSQAVRLVAEIEQTEDTVQKQKLVNQLKALVDSIVNDDETKIKLKVAIDNQEAQESARIAFEEYQKSPEWVIATGDLANMSKQAINTLIKEIEAYKKSAKNLSPKQIKQINSALKSLYKEQRQGNPFGYIKNMLDRAKDKADEFNEEIEKTQKEIDKLSAKNKQNILEGIVDEKTKSSLNAAIKKLGELKQKQKEVGTVDASAWVGAINETAGAVQGAVGLFNDLAKAISGVDKTIVDDIFSVIGSAGSAAATGAMIGGGAGAIAGAVLGAVTGIAKVIGASDSINSEIEKSLLEVKKLENAYKRLEFAIEDTYGVAKIGYRQAAIANKELQLAELQRQLTLEQSRTGKERDNSRIEELKGQIIDLKNEIKHSSEEIVADLLGISSVGSAAEQLMGEYIDALRRGEDASKAFTGSYKEMIANMIKQLYVTKVIGPQLEGIMDSLNDRIEERTKRESAAYEDALRMKTTADEMKYLHGEDAAERAWYNQEEDKYETTGLRYTGFFDDYIYAMAKYFKMSASDIAHLSSDAFNELWDRYIKDAEKNYKDTSRALKNASIVTIDDMDMVAEDAADILPLLKASEESINSLLERYDLFIDDSTDKKLSALQQGIQGITEDTAGALEAYMNGVSQQVYYHSTLLEEILAAVLQIGGIDTLNPEVMERVEAARQANAASLPQQTGDTVSFVQQIRDIVSGFPLEEQTGIQAQMLLQLQQSYQVQASIHSLLDGWNNASGQAVRVELVS